MLPVRNGRNGDRLSASQPQSAEGMTDLCLADKLATFNASHKRSFTQYPPPPSVAAPGVNY
jgi:hypothetical protein